jgi:hypothetical protein
VSPTSGRCNTTHGQLGGTCARVRARSTVESSRGGVCCPQDMSTSTPVGHGSNGVRSRAAHQSSAGVGASGTPGMGSGHGVVVRSPPPAPPFTPGSAPETDPNERSKGKRPARGNSLRTCQPCLAVVLRGKGRRHVVSVQVCSVRECISCCGSTFVGGRVRDRFVAAVLWCMLSLSATRCGQ